MLGEKQPDGTSTEEEEIAIKKVLQDKRFKVRQIPSSIKFPVRHDCTPRLPGAMSDVVQAQILTLSSM